MMRFVILVLSLAVAGEATAATVKQCSTYANQAVDDFMLAQKFVACKKKVSNRWQPNYPAHYNWCRSTTLASTKAEGKIRHDHLVKCGAVVDMAEPGMNPVE